MMNYIYTILSESATVADLAAVTLPAWLYIAWRLKAVEKTIVDQRMVDDDDHLAEMDAAEEQRLYDAYDAMCEDQR
jgi:hypothetical protein|tara:strand:- start:380 stop:607 length:228 start_codon:yes stop_codon:yes gene_type:complete